ncbi:MAG: flagellar motor switch protein FliN [Phycisphaeraceae bacterium]|nr:flagellar motor switch protein FliN [Phycisphaeraceae bacterium]MCW5754086.1 flagellar motor switch protein FliN [Phycisphaeraceae bacterium]
MPKKTPPPTDPPEQPHGDADAEAHDLAGALHEAQEAIDSLKPAEEGGTSFDARDASPFALPSFQPAARSGEPEKIDLLGDVTLNVKIELGRTRMLVEDVLRLGEGAVVELDKLAGDPVDVYVNERLVARGEVLVLNDNFCVRIHEIVDTKGEEQRRSA